MSCYEIFERGGVGWYFSLAANYLILLLIRITIQIREFFNGNFYQCGIDAVVKIEWDLLPLQRFAVSKCSSLSYFFLTATH